VKIFNIIYLLVLIILLGMYIEVRVKINKTAKLIGDVPTVEMLQMRARYISSEIDELKRRVYYHTIMDDRPWYLNKTTWEIDSIISVSRDRRVP